MKNTTFEERSAENQEEARAHGFPWSLIDIPNEKKEIYNFQHKRP
jgi:hypothetical protein